MKESKELTEHLWSGIIHRSETGEVRKEDDVNLLDKEGLFNYILKHYNFPSNQFYVFRNAHMAFGLTTKNLTDYIINYYEYKSYEYVTIVMNGSRLVPSDIVEFLKKHGIKTNIDIFTNQIMFTPPIDNKSFLEIFDLVIEYFKNKNGTITKKK